MAAFHFELVSPDKLQFNGPAKSVLAPGSDGDSRCCATMRR